MQGNVGYDDHFSPHLKVIKSFHIYAVDSYQSDGVNRYEMYCNSWLVARCLNFSLQLALDDTYKSVQAVEFQQLFSFQSSVKYSHNCRHL